MAKYKRNRVSLDEELNIAIGLIVSSKFNKDFKELIHGTDGLLLFKSSYISLICKWSMEYYEKYENPPVSTILDIFKSNKKAIPKDEDVDLIADTLETINNKYIEDNVKFDADFIFNQTESYLKGRSLIDNSERVKGLVSQGKIIEAENIHNEYQRIEKSNGMGLNAFHDMEAINNIFTYDKSVFNIPGAFGELVQEIAVDDLIMIGGNSKFGKSWLALQMAIYASNSGLKVAYFSFEMKKELMNKRLAQCVVGGSIKEVYNKLYVPYFDKNSYIKYKKTKIKQLTPKNVSRAYKLLNNQSKFGEIHFYDSTTGGRTVDAIKNTIQNESEYNDLDFDFIIIDQISLVAGGRGKEKRHQLEDIAIRLKTEICSDMQIPVLTPVQFNKSALKTGGGEDTIAESYALFHNASILISLNRTKEESARGLLRISASGRNNDYSGEVLLLQNLTMGRFILDSRWLSEVPNYNDIVANWDENDNKEVAEIVKPVTSKEDLKGV